MLENFHLNVIRINPETTELSNLTIDSFCANIIYNSMTNNSKENSINSKKINNQQII